ncbi:hypothetical protein DI005_13270 [Prauserella sp. PE36]|uniref:hypothetical protein n=1 Tax=Prauserella sp. PE36 TaxID=1504709 RepID=UPI000DE4BF25|nr:hypothetical protein [Prauserella sp. PE36]RBM20327.1 hypothetical protein DI005_13270 [Prauserella sp. PE36]
MKPRAIGLSALAAGLVATVITVSAVTRADTVASPEPQSTTRAPVAEEAFTRPPLTPTTEAPAPERERAKLAQAVSGAVASVVPGTRMGLAVYDRLTDSMLTSLNADEQFYTASVVKLLIVTEVLREADWRVPGGTERQELHAMLAGSADRVASALWGAYGGTEIDRDAAELMGLENTSPPREEGQWELTRMSPRDIVTVYEYLDDELPRPASDFVLGALADATRVAVDGFDQYFGIPGALPGTEWAVKQGWMEVGDGLVLNTTGIVGSDERYIVSLLAHLPAGTGFAEARTALTAGIAALAPSLDQQAG